MQHGVCQGTATARTSLNTRAVVSDVPNVIFLQPRAGKGAGSERRDGPMHFSTLTVRPAYHVRRIQTTESLEFRTHLRSEVPLAGGSSTASRMAVVSAAPMNRNVKLVLIYVTCLSMYSSLTSGTPMTAYALLLRPDDYTAIGVMSGIQGTISLVMALPAGAISDCFGRQGMLRIAGVVALVSAAYMGAILLTLGTELENYLDQHQEHVVTASMPSKLTVGSDSGGAGVEASRNGFDGSLYSGSSSSSSIGGAGTDAGDASGLAAAGAAFATGRWRWGGAADLRGNWADEASSGDQPGSGEDAEATRIANELFYSLLGSSALWGIFMGLHSAPLEALFADSTVSGQRSKLFVWRSSLRTLGNVLGPLLSIIIFSQVDHPSWPLITLDCL